jgi:fatty-acid desaturase
MGPVALVGALLTALGFGIGDGALEFVVLAAFAVTLVGGLTVKFGLHRFVAGMLLNA